MSVQVTKLVHGLVQEYTCLCSRKTKFLKRWTSANVKIINKHPGFQVVDVEGNDIEVLFEVQQGGEASLIVEFGDDDPHCPEKFLGVLVTPIGKKTFTFHMKDIVQQRWLMACLGATGRGIFSPLLGEEERKLEQQWTGLWDIAHVETMQTAADIDGAITAEFPPSGGEVVLPQYTERGVVMYTQAPCCQATQEAREDSTEPLRMLQEGQTISNQPKHDTFLPPIGPPVYVSISIGYGLEVELQPGIQELWDPIKKRRFFIDHDKRKTFYQNARPLKQVPVPPNIEYRQILYGPDRVEASIPPVDRSSRAVAYHVEKAVSKRQRWGAWIVAKGIDGVSGTCGQEGMQGFSGPDGHNGEKGGVGLDGRPGGNGGIGGQGGSGTKGTSGTHGTNGSDVCLYLSGGPENLALSGSVEESINLGGETSECILCVDCSGGYGGHGGYGGAGGIGGNGGNGGGGGKGGSGYYDNRDYLQRNGANRGKDGGRGGNGASGGVGGTGGRGGSAGNSGNGGRCVIHSRDPKLLHLVEIVANAKAPGNGGAAGKGGQGGRGGFGGPGGKKGAGSAGVAGRTPPGPFGNPGTRGSDGLQGYCGADGQAGNNGIKEHDGGIQFVLHSSDGQNIIEQSAYRFEVKVEPASLVITSAVDDGVFEPNEQITVKSLTLHNIGGMTLPEGSTVTMVSPQTVKFHPTKVVLPVLAPQHTMTITQEYIGRIFDVPPPNSQGPYLGKACFETRVDLLGRPFDSAKTIHKLIVQYPIKIESISIPENLGRGELGTIDITIVNISTLAYGNFPESGGQVALRLHFDRRIVPFANTNTKTGAYFIHYNPNRPDSFCVDVRRIEAGGKMTITFDLAVTNAAELFDKCPFQTDLLLRGKLIEYQQLCIRVTPFYVPSTPPADILFVTDRFITRNEFVLWQKLFELLGVTVNFWDKDRYEGFSYKGATGMRHEFSWVGRHSGSLILFPNAPFKYLDPADLIKHLQDNSRVEVEQNVVANDSAVLLIDSLEPQVTGVSEIRNYVRNMCQLGESISVEGKDYGGNHLIGPDEGDLNEKQKEVIKNLEAEQPANRCYIVNTANNPERLKLLSFSYGTLDIRRLPVEQSAKLMIVTRSVNRFGFDDEHISVGQSEIPLATFWGQTLLYTLYGLSTHTKISILQGYRDQETNVAFVTPSGKRLELVDLAQLALTKEIIAEVKCLTMDMPKLAALTTRVTGDLEAFAGNYIHIFSIITAVKIFAKENVPKKNKEIKLKISEYCGQIKLRLIEHGGSSIREQFETAKSYSEKKKRIYFENLIDSGHTFEPHTYNQNILSNELFNIQ